MKKFIFVVVILLLSSNFCLADSPPSHPDTTDHYFFFEYFGGCNDDFIYDDDDWETQLDPFPPTGWSVLATNPDSTWHISVDAFGGSVQNLDDLGYCLATVEGGSDKPHNELLVTKKARNNDCGSYKIRMFFNPGEKDAQYPDPCDLSIEITQEDSLSNNNGWYVLYDDIYGGLDWGWATASWQHDDDFFDESKSFRIGFRYKGESCKGAAIDDVELFCEYKSIVGGIGDDNDDDTGDPSTSSGQADDDACGCSVGSNSVPPLLALLMAAIGLVALRVRRRG